MNTVGKRVQFDDEPWAMINLLRRERNRSSKRRADKAFTDLLANHGRRVELKSQMRQKPRSARAARKTACAEA